MGLRQATPPAALSGYQAKAPGFAGGYLLFNGTESAPFEGMIAEKFRILRPDAMSITIDGAGHNVHRDRPDIVNSAVLEFLGAVSR